MSNKTILNRFTELLAIKGRKEGRNISRREVAEKTGLAKATVDAYGNNTVTRFDAGILLTMCEYLDCTLQEFLVVEEREQSPETTNPLVA